MLWHTTIATHGVYSMRSMVSLLLYPMSTTPLLPDCGHLQKYMHRYSCIFNSVWVFMYVADISSSSCSLMFIHNRDEVSLVEGQVWSLRNIRLINRFQTARLVTRLVLYTSNMGFISTTSCSKSTLRAQILQMCNFIIRTNFENVQFRNSDKFRVCTIL